MHIVKPMTWRKVSLLSDLGKLIPGTHQLAIIAAVNSIAHKRPKRGIDTARMLNGQIGNTAARIELEGPYKCIGRANIKTGLATAAMFVFFRWVGRKWDVGIYLSQKKP